MQEFEGVCRPGLWPNQTYMQAGPLALTEVSVLLVTPCRKIRKVKKHSSAVTSRCVSFRTPRKYISIGIFSFDDVHSNFEPTIEPGHTLLLDSGLIEATGPSLRGWIFLVLSRFRFSRWACHSMGPAGQPIGPIRPRAWPHGSRAPRSRATGPGPGRAFGPWPRWPSSVKLLEEIAVAQMLVEPAFLSAAHLRAISLLEEMAVAHVRVQPALLSAAHLRAKVIVTVHPAHRRVPD